MTTEQKTQFIIGKAIEANPSILKECSVAEIHGRSGQLTDGRPLYKAKIYRGRPISLEDILMAWDKKAPKSMKTGRAMEIVWGIFCEWHFGKPFTEQSEGLKNFVYEILK